jgi:hypothetical protein
LARLVTRSLSSSGQDMSDTADLLEIIRAGLVSTSLSLFFPRLLFTF